MKFYKSDSILHKTYSLNHSVTRAVVNNYTYNLKHLNHQKVLSAKIPVYNYYDFLHSAA